MVAGIIGIVLGTLIRICLLQLQDTRSVVGVEGELQLGSSEGRTLRRWKSAQPLEGGL